MYARYEDTPVQYTEIFHVVRKEKISVDIMKTCPCNIQRFFSVVKNENFIRKTLIFFLLLLKT